jgi:hypothetical protein
VRVPVLQKCTMHSLDVLQTDNWGAQEGVDTWSAAACKRCARAADSCAGFGSLQSRPRRTAGIVTLTWRLYSMCLTWRRQFLLVVRRCNAPARSSPGARAGTSTSP